MIKAGDPQAVAVYEEYNRSVMNNFPQLSNDDIDKILAYTDYTPPLSVAPVASAIAVNNTQANDFANNLILAAPNSCSYYFGCNVIFSSKNFNQNS